MDGVIFDIKRFAIHDGPGIRTTVFLKGCPLTCFWCHNPESRKKGIEVFDTDKGQKTVGKRVELEELMQEILKDKVFYEHSGGGVSFSGGEPLMQDQFLLKILKSCKVHGLHTTVDTSGFAKREVFESILPYTDLFLYDLKMLDPLDHVRYAGVDNRVIIENLLYLDSCKANLVLRVPVLPGYNDGQNKLEKMVDIINMLKNKPKVHLLPYHKTGMHKYSTFCLEKPSFPIEPPEISQAEMIRDFFIDHQIDAMVGS